MFKTRLLSGIVLVIIALLTIMSGGYVLLLTLLCVSLIGMRELIKAEWIFWSWPVIWGQFFIMAQFFWDLKNME